MNGLRIRKGGVCSTIQDLGRPQAQVDGVAVGGAVDRFSHELANRLVCNSPDAATLEITLWGDELEPLADVVIAVTGGDLTPSIVGPTERGEMSLPQGRPVFLRAGTKILFRGALQGCRGYLAIAGGFDVPSMMESRSTHLRGAFGGYQGRSLRAGDVVPIGQADKQVGQWMKNVRTGLSMDQFCFAPRWFFRPNDYAAIVVQLRALRGTEYEHLELTSQQRLWSSQFKVLPNSDRMGCRLEGASLALQSKIELVSDGLVVGTLQLPPSGNPILILADGAPTGGYPRIAQIISADHCKAGQLRPGMSIALTEVSIEEAQSLYREQRTMMSALESQIAIQWRGMVDE